MLPKSKTLKRDCTEIRTEREENVLRTFLVTGQLAGWTRTVYSLPRFTGYGGHAYITFRQINVRGALAVI